MPTTLIHSEPERPDYDDDDEWCECDNEPDEEEQASGVCKACGRLIEC